MNFNNLKSCGWINRAGSIPAICTIRAPIVSKDTFGAFIIKIILNLLIIKKTGNDYDTATGKWYNKYTIGGLKWK